MLTYFPIAYFSSDVSLIFVTKLTNPNKSQLSTSRAIIKYCRIDLVQGGELLCTYIINSSSARIRNRGDLRHETPSLRFTIGSGTRHHRSIFSFESTSSIYSNFCIYGKTNIRESISIKCCLKLKFFLWSAKNRTLHWLPVIIGSKCEF